MFKLLVILLIGLTFESTGVVLLKKGMTQIGDMHGVNAAEILRVMKAGATSPQLQTETDMIKAIREAGRTPVQRNSFYEPIKVLETVAAPEPTENPAHSKVLEDNLATA